jgi:2-keto-4-pentenoate hydratase/2-oxohepta-3-ene-1,7-dioic acid hydratase in catechol pathway
MKLATFTTDGVARIGAVVDGSLVDLSRASPGLPTDMIAFLEAGKGAMERAWAVAQMGEGAILVRDVRLEAPVLRPRKFIAIGANYYLRAPLSGMSQQDFETLKARQTDIRKKGHVLCANKQVTCVNGPYDPVELPKVSDQLICEAELAFVIGQRCRHVSVEQAPSVIGGYLVCNDLTVVDWSQFSPTVTLGKSFNTHGPIGPWLVTPDEVGDPHRLGLRSVINGEEFRRGSTADMIFNCYEIVAYLSQVFMLEPGDIITTGMTPAPLRYLKIDDVVRCEVERIGHIENVVVKER